MKKRLERFAFDSGFECIDETSECDFPMNIERRLIVGSDPDLKNQLVEERFDVARPRLGQAS